MFKNGIWIFVVAILILVGFLPAFTQLQDIKKKNFDYAKEIEDLKQEKKELLEERRLLKEDPEYLEKVAREKMGIVREGEVVYRLMPEETE